MADYIHIYPDNTAKNDQIWQEICSKTIVSRIDKEIVAFEKEIENLDKNPEVQINYDLQTKEQNAEFQLSSLNSLKRVVIELQKSIESKNEHKIKEATENIEYQLQGNYEGLSEPSEPIYSFFVSLFKFILNMDVFEDFKSLTKVPTELWIKLFQNISKDAISKAVSEAGGNWDDDQKYYIWVLETIKEIVKHCKDKKINLVVRDDYEDAAQENKHQNRVDEILEKIENKECLSP